MVTCPESNEIIAGHSSQRQLVDLSTKSGLCCKNKKIHHRLLLLLLLLLTSRSRSRRRLWLTENAMQEGISCCVRPDLVLINFSSSTSPDLGDLAQGIGEVRDRPLRESSTCRSDVGSEVELAQIGEVMRRQKTRLIYSLPPAQPPPGFSNLQRRCDSQKLLYF